MSFNINNNYLLPTNTLHIHSRSKMPAVLLINHSLILFPKLDLFFSLTVIDASGKILYNKIYVKKWSHLHDEIFRLQKCFNIQPLLIEDKDHMVSIVPRT